MSYKLATKQSNKWNICEEHGCNSNSQAYVDSFDVIDILVPSSIGLRSSRNVHHASDWLVVDYCIYFFRNIHLRRRNWKQHVRSEVADTTDRI